MSNRKCPWCKTSRALIHSWCGSLRALCSNNECQALGPIRKTEEEALDAFCNVVITEQQPAKEEARYVEGVSKTHGVCVDCEGVFPNGSMYACANNKFKCVTCCNKRARENAPKKTKKNWWHATRTTLLTKKQLAFVCDGCGDSWGDHVGGTLACIDKETQWPSKTKTFFTTKNADGTESEKPWWEKPYRELTSAQQDEPCVCGRNRGWHRNHDAACPRPNSTLDSRWLDGTMFFPRSEEERRRQLEQTPPTRMNWWDRGGLSAVELATPCDHCEQPLRAHGDNRGCPLEKIGSTQFFAKASLFTADHPDKKPEKPLSKLKCSCGADAVEGPRHDSKCDKVVLNDNYKRLGR